MGLRPYQLKARDDIYASWAQGSRNAMAVMPTGSGKTRLFSSIIHEHKGSAVAIAHRQELVTQISLALAGDGVQHRIIGPDKVVRLAVRLHMEAFGRSPYDPNSRVAVAGVDTLIRRPGDWMNGVSLWVTDECHHILNTNKWGEACRMFPNAKGLGVTATPLRADGKGLGRHADGVFDDMIVGPSMRELIDMGFLTDYRIFAPPNDIDLATVATSRATGDYSRPGMVKAVRKSRVVGDVVKHYLKLARGKLGITFASDVETATDIADRFNEAGVPAAVVHAKTLDADRIGLVRKFKNRELMQLVNVDLFGEGFDLPAIEVVSMARPTQSYGLYVQQFGRAGRIMEGKASALIIDHVGNVLRHGLPDAPKEWTLDRREKRSKGGDGPSPLKACVACTGVYERIHAACPYCDHVPVPLARSGPEFVDGDLTELDPATLAQMRGDVAAVDRPAEEYGQELAAKHAPQIGVLAGMKRHRLRQDAQEQLRSSIAMWAGYLRAAGRPDSEIYRRFYLNWGVDVLRAQALGASDAEELKKGIDEAVNSGRVLG